jgi:hypothetical protein
MDCQFPKLIKMMNSSVDCQTNIEIILKYKVGGKRMKNLVTQNDEEKYAKRRGKKSFAMQKRILMICK